MLAFGRVVIVMSAGGQRRSRGCYCRAFPWQGAFEAALR
jgi:hypothetical protein